MFFKKVRKLFFRKIKESYIFIGDFFLHFCGFVKVILVGAVFTFSTFTLYLSLAYDTLGGLWITIPGVTTGVTLIYFLFSYRKIKRDYLSWHEGYITWVDKTTGGQKFIISAVISISLSATQMALINMMEYLVRTSPGTVANTSLFVLNVANFFLLRTYTFNNQEKNYLFQAVSYIGISALAFMVNGYIVQTLAMTSNPYWLSFSKPFVVVLGKTGAAQLWWSIVIGWVWYLAYKNITFKSRV